MDSDYNKSMAQRLIHLSKPSGLTQVDVAHPLGVSQGTYAHFERGFRRIPHESIPSLALALNTSEKELFGLKQKNRKRGSASHLDKRFERIRSLPPTEHRFVTEMIDHVLGEKVIAS